MTCRFLGIFLLLVTLCPLGLRAQEGICQVQSITVEHLANGMRIRIKADGLIDLSCDPGVVRYNWQTGLTIRMNNVRGGAAPMVEIGEYPISHLEFALPKDAANGVGLLCTIMLYRQGQMTIYSGGGPYGWDDTSWASTAIPQVMIVRTQQKNEILIMVTNDRYQQPEHPDFPRAPEQLSVTGNADTISLQAVNADIAQVVEQLSYVTDVPIYLDEGLQQCVSANLTGMPLTHLLRVLADGYGLSISRRNNAYYLSKGVAAGPIAYENSETRTIPLRYLSPEKARSFLPDFLLPTVRLSTDANAVIVSGTTALLDKITRDLHELDQPNFHCQLRAWIISCDQADDQLYKIMAQIAGGETRVTADSDGRLELLLDGRQAKEILTQINALATKFRMRVETVPELQVASGSSASLFVGQKAYYWRIKNESWGQNLTLSSIEAGTRLDVSPRTSGEWITTSLHIENAFFRNATLGPLVLRQSTDSTVRVRSGDTILIGGLRLAARTREKGAPLLGSLFTRRANNDAQQEVWILLQAQAVSDARTVNNDQNKGMPL